MTSGDEIEDMFESKFAINSKKVMLNPEEEDLPNKNE
jgi:hypothetical protein